MHRLCTLSIAITLAGAVILAAQDEGGLRSGPKEGALLPGPFACYNFNGPHKGQFHCLVCRYAQDPSLLIFVRESEEGKDAALTSLFKRLDTVIGESQKVELHAAAIYLSPDAQSSVTNPKEDAPENLVEEAKKRDLLYARMSTRAADFQRVEFAVLLPEGPKGYAISPKAEVTVVFYMNMRVVLNRAFAPGTMREEDVDAIVAKVKDTLEPNKKKG